MLPRESIWATPSQMGIPYVFCILAIDLRDKSTQNSWKNLGNKNGFLANDAAIVDSDSDCSDWFGMIFSHVLL